MWWISHSLWDVFRCQAPSVWKSLPSFFANVDFLATFKSRRLKTYLFRLAFDCSEHVWPQPTSASAYDSVIDSGLTALSTQIRYIASENPSFEITTLWWLGTHCHLLCKTAILSLLSNPDLKLTCFLPLFANYSTYLFRQRLCSRLTALWRFINFVLLLLLLLL